MGLQASGGKGSAKHASDAGLMAAWYGAPQPLAASRWRRRTKRLASWRHRKVSNVPRRNCAAARSTRRKGTERHVAVARESGATSQRPLRCGARETARPRRSSGLQRATGRGARSRALTSERSDVVSRHGATHGVKRRTAGAAGVVGARRGRRMRRQGNTRQGAMPQLVAGSGLPAGRA